MYRPSQYGAPILQGKRSQFLGSLGVAARMLGVAIEYSSEVVGYVDSDTPAAYLSSGEMHTADVSISFFFSPPSEHLRHPTDTRLDV
jgi:hypothetical protein